MGLNYTPYADNTKRKIFGGIHRYNDNKLKKPRNDGRKKKFEIGFVLRIVSIGFIVGKKYKTRQFQSECNAYSRNHQFNEQPSG